MGGRGEVCLGGAQPRGARRSEVGVASTPTTAACRTMAARSTEAMLSCIMTDTLRGTKRARKIGRARKFVTLGYSK